MQIIVLENIQNVIAYVKSYEDLFIQEQLAKSTQDELKQITKNKKELEKAKEELQKRNEKKKEQSSVLAESINLNNMEVKNRKID